MKVWKPTLVVLLMASVGTVIEILLGIKTPYLKQSIVNIYYISCGIAFQKYFNIY